jgi:hypothetical protein
MFQKFNDFMSQQRLMIVDSRPGSCPTNHNFFGSFGTFCLLIVQVYIHLRSFRL